MSPRLLSIDPGRRLGYCCGPVDGEPIFGTVTLPDASEGIGWYLYQFDLWLRRMHEEHDLTHVTFERFFIYYQRGTRAAQGVYTFANLCGSIERFATIKHLECFSLDNQVVKKSFTGAGGKKGTRIVEECRRRGFDVNSTDAADAIAIWVCSLAKIARAELVRFDPINREAC